MREDRSIARASERAITSGMDTIVLTRDPADVQPYSAALAELGLRVVAMPVTRTVSAGDPDALTRALADGTYAAIVVASPRAAHALVATGQRERMPEIWCVGPATRDVIAAAGLPAQLPDDVRDGAELAAALAAARDLGGQRVLVPRPEHGRPELLDGLRDAGAIVVDVLCYRTVPAASDDPAVQTGTALLARGGARLCGVFAPSQVTALATIAGDLRRLSTQFCAIGDTTAAALRDAGIAQVAVAPAPTPEGMAHAVRSVYPTRQ
jgi:uroporphyrinogen-III synthase